MVKNKHSVEAWWATLKEGGPITSSKAGITNMSFGPKKKKPKVSEKKVSEKKVIPDEPDFWRD